MSVSFAKTYGSSHTHPGNATVLLVLENGEISSIITKGLAAEFLIADKAALESLATDKERASALLNGAASRQVSHADFERALDGLIYLGDTVPVEPPTVVIDPVPEPAVPVIEEPVTEADPEPVPQPPDEPATSEPEAVTAEVPVAPENKAHDGPSSKPATRQFGKPKS